MKLISQIDQWHQEVKNNRWHRYFSIFCRIALAAGFLPSGFVKIARERFTSLSVNHPMGHYLEALHETGYYYTFIGIMQVTAAILLLIPRTATLGAVLYFPIILNICILSLAVRFEGSLLSSPLMVLANLYLLFWDYDKLKFLLPFNRIPKTISKEERQNKFPLRFFGLSLAVIIIVIITIANLFEIQPHNTLTDCQKQCKDSDNPQACMNFCDCIHVQGKPIEKCLEEYEKAKMKH